MTDVQDRSISNLTAATSVNSTDIIPVVQGGATKKIDVQTLAGGICNLRHFGAIGDGSTDDTAAIAAWLAASLNGKGYVPAGTYKIATSISSITGAGIDIEFEDGAVFDGSSSTDAILITLGGALGSGYALSSNAAKGASSISVTGNTFAAGDVIRLQSTATWSVEAANMYKGEMARVTSVSGATVYLDTTLYDSYTAATTTVTKYTMGRMQLKNFRVLRASDHEGVRIQYVKDFVLDNMDVRGANERNIYLLECFNGEVRGGRTYGSYYSGTTTAYGLVLGTVQHVTVDGGMWVGGRHGVATGGTFPARDIRYANFTVDSDVDSSVVAFDAHSNVEFLEIENCTSLNGAGFNSINTRIRGGHYLVRSGSSINAALRLQPFNSGTYLEVRDVYTENHNSIGGVEVRFQSDALTFDRIVIDGVTARTTATSGGAGSLIAVNALNGGWTETIKKLAVQNCDSAFTVQPTAVSYALAVGVTGTINADVYVTNNRLAAPFTNASSNRAFYYDVTGDIYSAGNTLQGKEGSGYSAYVNDGNFYSYNDDFDATGARGIFANTSGSVHLINQKLTGASAVGGLEAPNASDVRLAGRILSSVTGTPSIGAAVPVTTGVSADNGDAAATLTAGTSAGTQRWATPLTADRAATLSTTSAFNGAEFLIVRTAASTGAFNLNVGTGPLKALGIGEWCIVKHNGSAWMLVAYGAL